jgi:hypothetical protein
MGLLYREGLVKNLRPAAAGIVCLTQQLHLSLRSLATTVIKSCRSTHYKHNAAVALLTPEMVPHHHAGLSGDGAAIP